MLARPLAPFHASLLTVLLIVPSGAVSSEIPVIRLPVVDGHDLRFVHVPFGEGSAHSRVGQIAQDNQGFLWFGTQNGLQRYDGYRFREYRHDPGDPRSLSGSNIYGLFKDRAGKLWVGSDKYLDRYDPTSEVFNHFRPDPATFEGWVSHMSQDRDGAIWLATNHGLNRLDPAKWQTVRYRHRDGDSSTIGSDLVRCTLEERDGTFWVATAEGLDEFDRRAGKVLKSFPLPAGTAAVRPHSEVALFEDHAGVIWAAFSFGSGLATVDRGRNHLTFYSFGVSGSDTEPLPGIRTIHEDADGVLWFGTAGDGVLKLDRERKHFVRYRHNPADPASLTSDQVVAMIEDREGNVWVGTTGGGLDRFQRRPLPFTRYSHQTDNPNSLETDYTSAVFEDSRRTLWVGSSKALTSINRTTGKFTFYRKAGGPDQLASPWVISIAEDRSGRLWFGTIDGGLNRFDPRTDSFKAFRHDPANADSIPNDTVLGLTMDREGKLWVGTENGLCAFDVETERCLGYRGGYRATGDEHIRYRSLAEGPDGSLWLGTLETGLRRLDPTTGKFTVYRHSDVSGALSNDQVNAVAVDRAGVVWAASQNGLNRFDPATHSFTTYFERDGLPNSTLNSIVEDKNGNLWLGTGNGLSRFNPRTGSFRNYYASDGLLGNEFYNYASACRSAAGEIILNSYAGVIAFFPDRVADRPYTPPVVVTNFLLFGKETPIGGSSPLKQSISVPGSLTLSRAQNIFALEFSALSYVDSERIRYRYRLEGLQKTWNETDSHHRLASYTTLAPRDYVFRVQARVNRGVWSDSTTLPIRVLPPLWSTWWFRCLAAVIVLAAVWSAYYLRLRAMRRRNRELELQVAQRTVELQAARENADAANRAKSVFLANMSHELRTPLNAVLGFARLLSRRPFPPEVQHDLKIIQDNGSHLLMLINHVLDLSKIESGQTTLREVPTDLHQLLDELERTFSLQAREKGVRLVVDLTDDVPFLVYLDQLKLHEVLLNLLGNAIKFTVRGTVELRAALTGPVLGAECNVAFEVIDTGPGIADSEIGKVFDAFTQTSAGARSQEGSGLGLTISYKYVKLMGGELRLQSKVGMGTTAHFEIPMRIAEEAVPPVGQDRIVGLSPGTMPYRILVADDNPETRCLYCRLLDTAGFEVREARDGLEAVAITSAWHPHLVCMDVRMPVMDGCEATRRIKAEAATESTIVIGVTASSFEQEHAGILAAGCHAVIGKPFDDAELFEVIGRCLGVGFRYEQTDAPVCADLSPERLRALIDVLPRRLTSALRTALLDLDIDAVSHVMDEIRAHSPAAFDTLGPLVDEYQYGRLLRAIEGVQAPV